MNRPFSIAGLTHEDGSSQVSVLYKVRGPGTRTFRTFAPGRPVTVFGPLGARGFQLPAPVDRAIVAAGGLGLAGTLFWLDQLVNRGVPATVLVGSPTAGELPLPEPLRQGDRPVDAHVLPGLFAPLLSPHVALRIATDDGSIGFKGFVSRALESLLADKPADEKWVVYGCGPWPMLKSIAALAQRENLACQVSLEEMMACGIGTCQACVIGVYAGGKGRSQYKLCCTHGPVFDAEEIVWE